jgi:hypothetical protein
MVTAAKTGRVIAERRLRDLGRTRYSGFTVAGWQGTGMRLQQHLGKGIMMGRREAGPALWSVGFFERHDCGASVATCRGSSSLDYIQRVLAGVNPHPIGQDRDGP